MMVEAMIERLRRRLRPAAYLVAIVIWVAGALAIPALVAAGLGMLAQAVTR
jgi:hypothetical protein